jgi:nicotinamide mononucleotide transporter
MSSLSILAFVFGVAGVWFTIQKSIWCWPLALVSVISSSLEFYQQRLFGDMSLQGVYFVAGIYGWYYWNQKQNETFYVQVTPKPIWFWLFLITAFQSVLYYFLLKKLRGDQALFDAILTAGSISATYMMTKRWIENWFIWVIIDLAYVVLYGLKFMWLFAILYFVFAGMAWYGWKQWKTEALKK